VKCAYQRNNRFRGDRNKIDEDVGTDSVHKGSWSRSRWLVGGWFGLEDVTSGPWAKLREGFVAALNRGKKAMAGQLTNPRHPAQGSEEIRSFCGVGCFCGAVRPAAGHEPEDGSTGQRPPLGPGRRAGREGGERVRPGAMLKRDRGRFCFG